MVLLKMTVLDACGKAMHMCPVLAHRREDSRCELIIILIEWNFVIEYTNSITAVLLDTRSPRAKKLI
jgi:hypothetical protein